MLSYVALSGPGGIGKTSSLEWLAKHFSTSRHVVTLGDIDPPDLTQPLEEIVWSIAFQKLKRDAIIRQHIANNVLLFADRTYLDPLALALALLDEAKCHAFEEWYDNHDFLCGHHIFLTAPHSTVRERRVRRGSSPRTSWLRHSDMSQEHYETECAAKWRLVHMTRSIPFCEVDFSSEDASVNIDRLLAVVEPLVEKIPFLSSAATLAGDRG